MGGPKWCKIPSINHTTRKTMTRIFIRILMNTIIRTRANLNMDAILLFVSCLLLPLLLASLFLMLSALLLFFFLLRLPLLFFLTTSGIISKT